MVNYLLVLCLLALFLHQGDAISCYICSSSRDSHCKDPFQSAVQSHKSTHCTQENVRNLGDFVPGVYNYHSSQPEEFVCVKAVTRENDREVVLRSCSIPRADTFDVCAQLKSRDLVFCQTCVGDNCNGALRVGAGALLSLLPAVLLVAKY